MRSSRRIVSAFALAAAMVVALPASAQAPSATVDAKMAAKEAYKRGEAALAKDDFAGAASAFVQAHETLANDVALKIACDAVVRTEDAALAARVLEQTSSTSSAEVTRAAKTVEQKFGGRLARILLRCAAKTCNASENGRPLSFGAPHWTTPGSHTIETRADDGKPTDRTVDAVPGAVAELTISAPPPGAPPTPPSPTAPPTSSPLTTAPPPAASSDTSAGGLSPVWFFVGVGATLVLGGIATWSTLDLYSTHDDFIARRCATPDCADLASDGKAADTRTIVLWGATGFVAALTAATGIFLVRWSPRASVGLAPLDGGAMVGISIGHR